MALLDDHDGFDGACAATDDEQHVLIALNGCRPGERIRFSAAHELCRWVMNMLADMPERVKETCCHRFTAGLLYPAERVRADFGGWQPGARIQHGLLCSASMGLGSDVVCPMSADAPNSLEEPLCWDELPVHGME